MSKAAEVWAFIKFVLRFFVHPKEQIEKIRNSTD